MLVSLKGKHGMYMKQIFMSQTIVIEVTSPPTYLSKQILINGESQIQICRVILQNPHQGVEIFAVLIR